MASPHAKHEPSIITLVFKAWAEIDKSGKLSAELRQGEFQKVTAVWYALTDLSEAPLAGSYLNVCRTFSEEGGREAAMQIYSASTGKTHYVK